MTLSEDRLDREQRAAKNQSLFREINERVSDLNEGFSRVSDVGGWICECANDTYIERVVMYADEYEAIRRDGKRFFVAPGDEHVWPDVEVVTERKKHYWIVEKIGRAGRMTKQADPRTANGEGPLPLKT